MYVIPAYRSIANHLPIWATSLVNQLDRRIGTPCFHDEVPPPAAAVHQSPDLRERIMAKDFEKHGLETTSLEGSPGEETLREPLAESHYHDTDVFGHEEDHEVCHSQCSGPAFKSIQFDLFLQTSSTIRTTNLSSL